MAFLVSFLTPPFLTNQVLKEGLYLADFVKIGGI